MLRGEWQTTSSIHQSYNLLDLMCWLHICMRDKYVDVSQREKKMPAKCCVIAVCNPRRMLNYFLERMKNNNNKAVILQLLQNKCVIT